MTTRVRWAVALPADPASASGGRGRPWRQALHDDALLAPWRAAVTTALVRAAVTLDDAAWSRLVEASGETAAAARKRAATLPDRRTMAAHARYAGPVAQRLDGATLTGAQRRHVLFVAAAAGIVRSGDLVPDERLGFSRSLPGLGPLAAFWRPHLTAWLDAALTDDGVLWDVLGAEHARALDVPAGRLRSEVVFRRGDRAAPQATARQLRGLVARHLARDAEHPHDPERALAAFDVQVAGDRWCATGSSAAQTAPRGQQRVEVTVAAR